MTGCVEIRAYSSFITSPWQSFKLRQHRRSRVRLYYSCNQVFAGQISHIAADSIQTRTPCKYFLLSFCCELISLKFDFSNGFVCVQGFESAFQKYERDKVDSLGLPYDYGSIMHYPFNAFSKNGQPTLRTLQPLNGKSPYKILSDLDAQQTNKMYGCSSSEPRRKRRQTRKLISCLIHCKHGYYVETRDKGLVHTYQDIFSFSCALVPSGLSRRRNQTSVSHRKLISKEKVAEHGFVFYPKLASGPSLHL